MADDIRVTNEPFPLDRSLCRFCENRMSITFIPLDPEFLGLDEETISNLDIPDDEEIQIEQHTCLVLHQDMDFIVTTCSHFRHKKDRDLLHNMPY